MRQQAGTHTIDHEEAGGMSEHEKGARPQDQTGYGAASEGDMEDAPDQVQPQTREPASEKESEQDAYANTADEES